MSPTNLAPFHAAQIFYDGNQLVLVFPPTPGHQSEHSVNLPMTDAGWGALCQLLIARRAEPQAGIGNPGVPTSEEFRHQIEHQGKKNPKCRFCQGLPQTLGGKKEQRSKLVRVCGDVTVRTVPPKGGALRTGKSAGELGL